MDEDIDEVINNLTPLICDELLKLLKREKSKRKRRCWVKPWIMNRVKYGASDILLRELAEEDTAAYRNIMRMSKEKFQELLLMVEPLITKEDTCMRAAISARTKLEITLRFLASGDSYHSLMYLFRVPSNTISLFIPEVLRAIYTVLQHYIQVSLLHQLILKNKLTLY